MRTYAIRRRIPSPGPEPRTEASQPALTTQLPRAGTEADRALRASGPGGIFDVVDLFAAEGVSRLTAYARSRGRVPLSGFWSEQDLAPGKV